jgi:hypothetical protein
MARENETFLTWAMEKTALTKHEVQQFVLNSSVSEFEHQLLGMKLRLLDRLIEKGGVKLNEAMSVVITALSSRKRDVRIKAVGLFIALARQHGKQVRAYFSKVPTPLRAAVGDELGWDD